MNHAEVAKRLKEAEASVRALKPISAEFSGFSLEDGYAVQKLLLENAIGRGEKLVGYKMGLTSRAKQRDVKVYEPIRGFLLGDREILKGEPVRTSRRIHPRAEPEVAVILKAPLAGASVGIRDVMAAVGQVVPAIEILDSRFEAFSFSLPDVVADNTSASGFILGSTNLIDECADIPLMGVTVKRNGAIVETGAPAAVLGDPFLSVVALVRGLAVEGKGLGAGMVVLTGGITASIPFAKGDVIETVWPREIVAFRAVE